MYSYHASPSLGHFSFDKSRQRIAILHPNGMLQLCLVSLGIVWSLELNRICAKLILYNLLFLLLLLACFLWLLEVFWDVADRFKQLLGYHRQ